MSDEFQLEVTGKRDDSSLSPSKVPSGLIARGRRDAAAILAGVHSSEPTESLSGAELASAQAYVAYTIALKYANGEGVAQDDAEAARWYRKAASNYASAAEQGDADAQCTLGFMYANGQGVPQDYSEAVAWYRKAADGGNTDGRYALGIMYFRGHGVPQDYKEAVRWYRLAADQGNAAAQSNLGLLYYEGQGVPQDYVQAHMWFNLAGASGSDAAMKIRDVVAGKMTPDQVAEAQRRAREWKPVTSR